MKLTFTILIIFWCHIVVLGQDVNKDTSNFSVGYSPSPIGGLEAVYSYISKKVNKKIIASLDTLDCNSLQGGKVYIGYIIDEQGNLKNPEVLKGIGNPYDSEALRLIDEMKVKWNPASKNGKSVATKMITPISFCNLKKEKKKS